jgi:hypothetical protein
MAHLKNRRSPNSRDTELRRERGQRRTGAGEAKDGTAILSGTRACKREEQLFLVDSCRCKSLRATTPEKPHSAKTVLAQTKSRSKEANAYFAFCRAVSCCKSQYAYLHFAYWVDVVGPGTKHVPPTAGVFSCFLMYDCQ